MIVCEPRPRWAPLLRRELKQSWSLLHVGNLDSCWEVLRQRPGSAVFLQVTPDNVRHAIDQILPAREQDPAAIFLASVPDLPRELRSALWHVGIVYAAATPLEASAAGRILRRHFSRLVPPALSLEEKIWNNLPWPQ